MDFGRRLDSCEFCKKAAALVFLPLAVFLLSGCQRTNLTDGLKMADEKVGEIFNNFQSAQQEAAINIFDKKTAESKASSTALTDEQKKQIDNWLDEKGLNRYGEAKNAIYTGGTPLFNEKTGKAIDRYDYIIKNHPNLLEELKVKK
jgi:hypothetical protein